MTDRELLQQVLTTLDEIHRGNMTPMAEEAWNKAIEAIRARLSQCDRCGEVNPAEIHTCTPKQEPLAWMYEWDGKKHLTFTDQRFVEKAHPHFNKSTPLYTTPPQREWQGLTDDEIEDAGKLNVEGARMLPYSFARAIEAKLKEKNT